MNKQLLSTLANPIRLKLLCCLSRGAKNVTQLIENCSLSQSAVSQHLARLKTVGLVNTTRVGKVIIYELKNEQVGAMANQLAQFVDV